MASSHIFLSLFYWAWDLFPDGNCQLINFVGQVLLLQETSNKLEQENKFMAEALEDLQDSTSRLEAENRTLKMGSPLRGRAGSASSGKVRVRHDQLIHRATAWLGYHWCGSLF